MKAQQIENILSAVKAAYDTAENEYYENGGNYETVKALGTVIENLEKALDPLSCLEADGII